MQDDHHAASHSAHARAGITLSACSRGEWQSVLLRRYTAPAVVEEVVLPASTHQALVLVTEGCFGIESRSGGRCQGARYRSGSLGMTAPGHEAVLRWRGEAPNETLRLHLLATKLRRVAADLSGMDPARLHLPNELAYQDPLVVQVMLCLSEALLAGAPDLTPKRRASCSPPTSCCASPRCRPGRRPRRRRGGCGGWTTSCVPTSPVR